MRYLYILLYILFVLLQECILQEFNSHLKKNTIYFLLMKNLTLH